MAGTCLPSTAIVRAAALAVGNTREKTIDWSGARIWTQQSAVALMSMRPAVVPLSALDGAELGEAAAVCGAAEALAAPATGGSGAGVLAGAAAVSAGRPAAAFGLVVAAAEPGNRPEPSRGVLAGLPGALAVGGGATVGGLAGAVFGELTGVLAAVAGSAAAARAGGLVFTPPAAVCSGGGICSAGGTALTRSGRARSPVDR